MSRKLIPTPCEFCGSFTCSFVHDEPGNREVRMDFILGERKKSDGTEAKTVDELASNRLWADMY